MSKQFVCRIQEVPSNGMKAFDVDGGRRVLVVNAGDRYYACQGICPHQDVALEEGLFDGHVLTCHQHLWQWKVDTGEPVGLAEAPLECYRVHVEEGSLYVVPQSTLELTELFSGISEATFSRISQLIRREEVDQSVVLYDVGDPAQDFFVLEAGRVEFVIGRDERMAPAGFMVRKGDVFGWAALLDGQPTRFAKAVCLEQSVLLRISGPETLAVLAADQASGYIVMRRLSSLIAKYMGYSGSK